MALCFMIMPYGRKATQVEPSSSAPGEIDFNALWDKAFAPTIQSLGYDPVRADQDTARSSSRKWSSVSISPTSCWPT